MAHRTDRWIFLVGICILCFSAAGAPAQDAATTNKQDAAEKKPEDVLKETYVKREYQVPTRDGVKLFTAVYAPKDNSKKYPILLFRTPYSIRPYGEDEFRSSLGPDKQFSEAGYIFVYQDVRGCFRSEGRFINMTPHKPSGAGTDHVNESTDTYDCIAWLLDNVENHNGRVGQWGISYPGFYSAAGMIDAHPALTAVSPQAPVSDWWYDDFHHHGAFFLAHAFRFLYTFGQPRPEPTEYFAHRFQFPTPDGFDFFLKMGPLGSANAAHFRDRVTFWNQFAEHPNYDDFWQSRNIVPHLKNCAPAVMTVGGWFDAEDLWGPLKIYRSVEEQNPDIFNILVMGPWAHGGWARSDGDKLGHVHFGAKTGKFYREQIQFPFFEQFLRDNGDARLPEAYVFETGTNHWCQFNEWPPQAVNSRTLRLTDGQGLTLEAPADQDGSAAEDDEEGQDANGADREAFDEFVSDPQHPVPFTAAIATGMTRAYMTDDQRFAARRPDVLVYQTEELKSDVTLCGPIDTELWVSTSQSAADWVVKLIDVFPGDFPDAGDTPATMKLGGYQMMVRSEVIRGRYRNSPEKPEPFEPDTPTQVNFELQDVLHTFRKGHRIMVQIQSTWFPLVDRNPQKYVDNIYKSDEDDFVKATHRVYRSKQHASRLTVGVLPQEF